MMDEWICEEVPEVTFYGIVLSTMLHKTEKLVRCKDCKHFDETQRGKKREENRRYVCDDFNPADDWFCADGERKETE